MKLKDAAYLFAGCYFVLILTAILSAFNELDKYCVSAALQNASMTYL